MSTPLPVPTKVAVTAIRGLIVGTTCSLALITEDRRRRIKSAHNALRNAEKIRSAKNYHAGGLDLALAIEEDAALFEPLHKPPTSTKGQWNLGRRPSIPELGPRASPGFAESGSGSEIADTPATRQDGLLVPGTEQTRNGDARNTHKPARARIKPPVAPPPIRRVAEPQKSSILDAAQEEWRTSADSARSPFAFPGTEEIRSMVERASAANDHQLLEQAHTFTTQALAAKATRVRLHDSMIDACAFLCCTCREMGNVDAALHIFRLVLADGYVAEAVYYSFQPLELLDEVIGKLEESAEDGRIDRSTLAQAVSIYCCKLLTKPQVRSEHGYQIGRRLIELSFAAGSLAQIEELYWRCIIPYSDGDVAFTEWYIMRLHENGEHKLVIKYFTLAYAKMSPTFASIEVAGTAVVESVVKAQGYQANRVLKALVQMCSGEWNAGELHSTWVMKLLGAHWTWKHNMDETAALFDSLKERGLKTLVRHPHGLWRVMMEIAYEAGRPDLADSYFQEAISEENLFGTDYLTVMLRATVRAKAGDWETAYQAIAGLGPSVFHDAYKGERISRRLVPILKLYAQNHTIAETDAFVRRFITELGVPICNHMVTFMANEYGSVRDVDSLLAWLEYCVGKEFKLDAASSNTILSNCRRTWKFPYRDLRKLYLKLKALGEGITDNYTERMMADAALSQVSPKKEWHGHLRKLLRSTRIPTSKRVVTAGKAYSAEDVILRMKEELVLRRPRNATKIYCQTIRRGFELPPQALDLAVKAALLLPERGVEKAEAVMRIAERRGVDTTWCAARIVKARLDSIDPTLADEQRYRAIEQVLGEVKANGLCGDAVPDVVLNQAAHVCLKANNAGAIKLALRAAQAHQDAISSRDRNSTSASTPSFGYNVFNFAVLLQAWTVEHEVKMLETLVATAKKQFYWTEALCLKALKNAHRTARNHRFPDEQVVALLGQAVGECVKARAALRDEGIKLQSGALEIMRAAAEAQKEGSDFEEALTSQRQSALEEMEARVSEVRASESIEELLMSKRHDPKVDMSLSSKKRRGALFTEHQLERRQNPVAQEPTLTPLEEALASQRHVFG